MKLTEALNEKNRLTRRIKEIQGRIKAHNSFIKGNSKIYDTRKLLTDLEKTTNELIGVKTKIANANQNVQEKIFRLSELKSITSFLKKMEIKEGKIQDQRWNAEVCEWESDLGNVECDTIIVKYEKDISVLQAELDEFNYLTEV